MDKKYYFLLLLLLSYFPLSSSVVAQESTEIFLLEDPNLTGGRLHFPYLITSGRGYGIRCDNQSQEEAIVAGLGFLSIPSTVLGVNDSLVEAHDPTENPLLCPSGENYPIKLFSNATTEGLKLYLQFPDDFNSTNFTDRIYIPGCSGLVDALNLDLTSAINADPTPFFQGKIHEIKCLSGTVLLAEPETFTAWCVKPDRTDSETATVMAMLNFTPGGISALDDPVACASADSFLSSLSNLNLHSANVQSIKPLSVMTQLTGLSLGDNDINDIAELAQLTQLSQLDLSGNSITNVAAVATMTLLTSLDLSDNSIEDIRTLATLSDLVNLNLNSNQISNLRPVQFLSALKELSLASNGLTESDLEPLIALALLEQLDLTGNQIESFANLGEFSGTLAINLSDNPVSESATKSFFDICVLHRDSANPFGHTLRALLSSVEDQTCRGANQALSSIADLDLSSSSISDVSPIGYLNNLRALNLSGNVINNVEGLTALVDLVSLDLSDNSIVDIRPVAPLTKLTSFNSAGNPINVDNYLSACIVRDQEGFLSEAQLNETAILFDAGGNTNCFETASSLSSMSHVDLSSRGLQSVNYFEVLSNIDNLNLQANSLEDVSALQDLQQLRTLNLSRNRITSLASLAGASRLQSLNVSNNPLNTMNFLDSLVGLESVNLSATGITSIRMLQNLPALQSATLSGLSINYNSIEDYCLVYRYHPLSLGNNRNLLDAIAAILEADGIESNNCPSVAEWSANKKSLNLNKKSVSGIGPLAFFTSLEELLLVDNNVVDLTPIRNLKFLKKLNLSKNQISIFPSMQSIHLVNLWLSDNRISDIKSIATLKQLTYVSLNNNKITSTRSANLKSLPKLKTIYLRNNSIGSTRGISQILNRTLFISGNPVCNSTSQLKPVMKKLVKLGCTRVESMLWHTFIDLDLVLPILVEPGILREN